MLVLTLPYPPSNNRLWRRAGHVIHKSSEYVAWLKLAGQHVMAQKRRRFDGPYSIHIAAVKPDKRRRDLGNLEKSTQDFLVSAGIVADDCNAQKISLEWVKEGPPITVTLSEVEP